MTSPPKSEPQPSAADSKFPSAVVQDKATGLLLASKMWWVTGACLLLAAWLAYQSVPETGPVFTIAFPEGHGLKPEDSVRYRGIEVGHVVDVRLSADLNRVDVDVMLNPSEANLYSPGSRFWIVRPRLSLTEVQGLETAVGAKYIAVSPGLMNSESIDQPLGTFEGLAVAPADELDRGGLQVVLRSDNRHGLVSGAAVSWRGVDVGRVLSVNLSPDGRHVHTTILIERSYRRLLNESSKFWVTSGFAVDVGLTGVKLDAESLASILNGGVSFATLSESKPGATIRSGHVFQLSERAAPGWLQSKTAVPLVDFALPETVLVSAQYQFSTLGIGRTQTFSQQGILAKDGSNTVLVTAALSDDAMLSKNLEVTIMSPGEAAVAVATDVLEGSVLADHVSESGLVSLPAQGAASISLNELTGLESAEDCLLFRSAVIDGEAIPLMQTIDLEQMAFQGDRWIFQDDTVDFSEWQGAAVVQMSTGKTIGILAIVNGRAQIAVAK
ncbi:MAG: MlaD family protein [Fuerstiella sp.]